MAFVVRHALHQGPVVAALGRTALAAARQRPGTGENTAPGPVFTDTVGPRDPAMVADYIRWAGGDVGAWKGRVPPHFFPQWGFPLIGQTLTGLSYPIARAMNGGCRMTVHGDIPLGAPLTLSAQLERIDDDGRRAILTQRLETRVEGALVLTSWLHAFVPLAGKKDAPTGPRKPARTVPLTAREVGRRRLSANAGFEFACLTGDFNPIHWVRPYARAFGFKSTILHGFGTLAIALEAVTRARFAGDTRGITGVDVRFTKPMRLPGQVGVYTESTALYVGSSPGAPTVLEGTFTGGEA